MYYLVKSVSRKDANRNVDNPQHSKAIWWIVERGDGVVGVGAFFRETGLSKIDIVSTSSTDLIPVSPCGIMYDRVKVKLHHLLLE